MSYMSFIILFIRFISLAADQPINFAIVFVLDQFEKTHSLLNSYHSHNNFINLNFFYTADAKLNEKVQVDRLDWIRLDVPREREIE